MTQEQKDQFFKEQEAKVEKLRRLRPWINIDKVEEVKPKEKVKYDYWKYHKKPMNSPDNRRKI